MPLPLVLGLIGAGVTAYGIWQQGQSQSDYLSALEAQGEKDAAAAFRAAMTAAENLRIAGTRQIRKERAAGVTLVSKQKAGYSKAGVRLIGTPREVLQDTISSVNRVMKDTARDVEADAIAILQHGTAEASRSRSMAAGYGEQAAWAETASWVNMGASLMTSYANWQMQDRQYTFIG
jgi:hypothetical protein